MKFDRKKFFTSVRSSFGKLTQKQVDALEFLLGAFEADPKWKDVRHVAYALGTIRHETANTYLPITEYGSKSYFNKYDIKHNPRKARELGNTQPGDGYRYRGAGFVQLTGRSNFAKFGIEDTPTAALEPDRAFKILSRGMHEGLYTGKKLSDFIKGSTTDYKGARKIINGTDKNILIAGYAVNFENALRTAQTSAAHPKPSESAITPAPNPQDPATPPPIVPPTGDAPPSIVAVQTPVVEVEQVSAATEDPIDKTLNKWSSRFVAVPAAALSFIGGAWSWVTSSPASITITLVIAGSVVAALYFGIRMIMNSRDKARQDRLQAEREQRAHELQILTLQSAMNKDMNTVRIVPMPIANSDNPANAEVNQ